MFNKLPLNKTTVVMENEWTTLKIHGILRDWGRAYFFNGVSAPKSVCRILHKGRENGIGHTVDVQVKTWFFKKKYRDFMNIEYNNSIADIKKRLEE